MTAIHPTAYVSPDCIVGENCRIGVGAKIGTLGLSMIERGVRKPSKGIVIIEDGVDVGAGTVIQRGVDGDTIIGKGTFIGSMCSIAHDVEIGEYCQIGPASYLMGRVKVGDRARIAPGALVNNRINIGDEAFIGLGSLVMKDVPAGVTVVGRPAIKIEDFRRMRGSILDR